MKSLYSKNVESIVTLPEFSVAANSSRHFIGLGPLYGVVPRGPGIDGSDTLQPSPFSDAKAVMLSYNYTLDLQGLACNVSCIYDSHTPIRNMAVPGNDLMAYNGSCDGLSDVFGDGSYFEINSEYPQKFWACKSVQAGGEDPAYYIYLTRPSVYDNITCTVSPIQPARFPVIYQSNTGVFSTNPSEAIATSELTDVFSKIIESAITIVGVVIAKAQTPYSNMFTDSVTDSIADASTQSWFLHKTKEEKILLLYAAMIQGIFANQVYSAGNSSLLLLMVVPQVTYYRIQHSAMPGSPRSCSRTVNGTLSAEVMGWVAKPVHIAFLVPMTIINLTSLVVILIAKAKEKRGCYEFDPSDPRPLVLAEPILAEGDPSGWTDGVSYRSREVCEYHTIPVLINNNWWFQWLRENVGTQGPTRSDDKGPPGFESRTGGWGGGPQALKKIYYSI